MTTAPPSSRSWLITKGVLLVILLSLAGCLGYGLGRRDKVRANPESAPSVNFTGTTPPASLAGQVDFSQFWDVWQRLSKTYIDKSALDPQKMVNGAIEGMVASLDDPYTVFLPPKENKDAKDDLGGQFEGIGASLGVKDKRIMVIAPLKGTPAEAAGIKPGDWIVKVDGKDTARWSLPEAVAKIRGPKGTKVVLTLLHEQAQKTIDISIVRGEIHVASAEWKEEIVDCTKSGPISCKVVKDSCPTCQKIAHLTLNRFGDKTPEEWDGAVNQVVESYSKGEVKGIVFDLRNNPGGYLNGAVSIASEFLSEGLVVTQQNYDGTKNVYDVSRHGKLLTQPVVVLVNKGSASASEIVAGAMKVRGRAKLVGQTTFGKGSVQDVQDLPNGAGLHVTISKWLLPDGKWINGTGVEPDVTVEMDEANPDRDPQLEKAAELLVK